MSIFCHKCGKQLAPSDSFCQSCGVKIIGETAGKNISEPTELKRKDLEKRAWFRALKVVYIIVIVITVLAAGAISWSEKPQKTIDVDKSTIACNNGKLYVPNKNKIDLYGWNTDLSYSEDRDARILCKYDSLDFYNHLGETIEKNYTFMPIFNDVKYGAWIGYSLVVYLILGLIFYLVRAGFFYIAVGEKPNWKFS